MQACRSLDLLTGTKSRFIGPNTKSFGAKLLLNRKIDVETVVIREFKIKQWGLRKPVRTSTNFGQI